MKIEVIESKFGTWGVVINGMPIMVGGDDTTKEAAVFNALLENQRFADVEIVIKENKK